jgi:hypothetical protein
VGLPSEPAEGPGLAQSCLGQLEVAKANPSAEAWRGVATWTFHRKFESAGIFSEQRELQVKRQP